MREIKFRGQRVDNNEWAYGDLIHGVGAKNGKMYILPMVINLATLPGCHPLDGFEVKSESVCQYTGLKDKNGKEIYEGDVIESASGKYKYIVEWHHASWIRKPIGWWRFTSLYQHIEREKIIGNIYENPELLNAQS